MRSTEESLTAAAYRAAEGGGQEERPAERRGTACGAASRRGAAGHADGLGHLLHLAPLRFGIHQAAARGPDRLTRLSPRRPARVWVNMAGRPCTENGR